LLSLSAGCCSDSFNALTYLILCDHPLNWHSQCSHSAGGRWKRLILRRTGALGAEPGTRTGQRQFAGVVREGEQWEDFGVKGVRFVKFLSGSWRNEWFLQWPHRGGWGTSLPVLDLRDSNSPHICTALQPGWVASQPQGTHVVCWNWESVSHLSPHMCGLSQWAEIREGAGNSRRSHGHRLVLSVFLTVWRLKV
jgi:hypothetical protein